MIRIEDETSFLDEDSNCVTENEIACKSISMIVTSVETDFAGINVVEFDLLRCNYAFIRNGKNLKASILIIK